MSNTVKYYNKTEAIVKMNQLGKAKQPFVFVIDYEMEKILISPLSLELEFDFNINGNSNNVPGVKIKSPLYFEIDPVSKSKYTDAFLSLQKELQYGNSFLSNLTFASKINTDLSLEDIYNSTDAKYKLHLPNQCVVFSPETFIQIRDGIISSYPMKGTIQANLANAKEKILADVKEKAEHSTIVDLIRNDLSMVANEVRVEDFRYVEKIENNRNPLLQVSSKISGRLADNFHEELGNLFFKLLPAGSICGAPKKKTVEIIADAEDGKRGYYTGVFGYFDGSNVDSAVMIRFIEKEKEDLYFRSGGGITAYSKLDAEYAELIDKIYVPLRKHTDTQRKSVQSSLPSSQV